MSQKLRFAIIGCGKIAPRHAAEAATQGELVAVCDIIKERADKLASDYNAKAYSSIEDLLKSEKDLGLIAICTPNGFHAQHSILSLQHGIHVLCEKPLCISTQDAKGMMNAAKNANRKLFVVKSTRYNPALASLKKLVDENKLGRLYSFQLNCFWNRPDSYYKDSWKGKLALDGGSLYTQFSHYIDALLWIFGEMDEVKGFRANKAHQDIIEFEDSGVCSIKMKNGMLGGLNWSVNTYEKNMEVSMTIKAENGTVRIGGEYMNKLEYLAGKDLILDIPDPGNPNDYGSYKGSMSNHDKVYENLVKALKDEDHPFTSAVDGLRTVEAIEKIYNSIAMGNRQ